MSLFDFDEIMKNSSPKFEQDPALLLQEELSTQKSGGPHSQTPSTSSENGKSESSAAQKQSRKRTKDQLKVLRKHFW